MNRKILVAGGAGFIGSNYVHLMVEKYPDDQIYILDKLTYAGNIVNHQTLLEEEKVVFVRGDIADEKFVRQLFEEEKFDIVVNFAAETHVDRSIIDPGIFVLTNIVGTHNLLMASRESNVKRYHQVSTDEVYGDLGNGSTNFFLEITPLAPTCPYAASKAAADLMVRSYFETYQYPATISRCSNNYGPFQFPEKLVPFFFKLASEDKPLPLMGDGLNVRDWLYVTDHCRAIDLIVEKGRPGEVYNIGGHNEKTNLEMSKLILKFLGKNENLIMYVNDRRAHDRRYAMDPAKIESELGWKPEINFENGIPLTFEWYKNNSEWVANTSDRIILADNIRDHQKIFNFKNLIKSHTKTLK